MPDPPDESWWNDPDHLVPALISVVSAALGDAHVQWGRFETATDAAPRTGAADHQDQYVDLCTGDRLRVHTALADGATGVLVAARAEGHADFTAHDLEVARAAARRLAATEGTQSDLIDPRAQGSMQRLLAGPDDRLGLKELLFGAAPPAIIVGALWSLKDADSYRPATLLLLAVVVAAAAAGIRAAVLSAVSGTTALWWEFTPVEHSWRIASVHDGAGLLVFLAAAVGVTALVVRLEEARAHEHVERQLSEILLDQTPEATAVFDRELRFRRVNDAMARMNGVPVADHVGRRTTEVSPLAGQLYEHLLMAVRDGGGSIIDHDLQISVPELGLERHWTLNLLPVLSHDHDVVGIGARITDVTVASVAHRRSEQAHDEEIRQAADAMRTVVELLQDAALPRALPQPVGVHLAASYQPADRSEPIGGDWYDAFELDDDHLALVIADVGGHGHQAAVFMVQVRNVFRALASEHLQPGEVLTRVNQVATSLNEPGGPFVTCCYAILQRSTGRLTWAQAGHFSPLVLHHDTTTTYLPEHPGPPLALTADGRYESSSVTLRPGDRVLMFTDGLVERRREHLDVGLARLAQHAHDHAALAPEQFVAALTATVIDRFDDLALLCVTVAPLEARLLV